MLLEPILSLVVQTPELLEAFQQRGGIMLLLNILNQGSMGSDEEEIILDWMDQLLEVASLSSSEQRVYDRWLARCIR
jgi:hypothetical protein